MKKLLTCLFFICALKGFAQKGQEYFNQSDYFNAARYLEIEAPKDQSLYLTLAKSYFGLKEFDQAIEAMKKYKQAPGADQNYADEFISVLSRNDEKVERYNVLGVNSDSDEYIPTVSSDGQTLFFIAKERTGGPGKEDIWYSTKNTDGTWGTPAPMKELNSTSNEGILSVSGDGNVMLVFGNYVGQFGSGDIFYTVKTKDGWSTPCSLGGAINTDSWESLAKLSVDGKTVIFCSNRDGGFGGSSDLYVSHLTETGWTAPKNLGATINTSGKDYSPFLAADGKTLYFSSDGHFSFGAADIFISRRLDDTWTNWSKPENLGKHINSLLEDSDLTLPASGIKAYISGSGQLENNGSYDIYEFILPSTMRPERLINVVGTVWKEEENGEPAGVIIKYINQESGLEVAKTISNSEDGRYGVSLPANNIYDVVIDMKGFLYYQTTLDFTDPSRYMKREPFVQKIALEIDELMAAKEKLDAYNLSMGGYLRSESFDIEEQFIGLENLNKSYLKELAIIESKLKDARYRWLTEAETLSEVEQNHVVQEIKVGASFEIENLFFDVAKASLRPESRETLDDLYGIMSKSEMVVEFAGHTDNTGSDDANMVLSQERVNSVVGYLAEKGIDPNRMNAVGYGETTPIADNETEDGRQRNRRVELRITQLRLEREGSGEISAEEEYDKIRQQEQKLLAANDPEELLSNLRNAAITGGLPANSPCSTLTDVASNVTDTEVEENERRRERSSSGDLFSDVDIDINDYIYKSFNPALYTYGTAEYGSSAGVGVNFVKKKNLREFYMKYYFANPENVKGIANLGWMWTFPIVEIADNPFLLHVGLDANLMVINNTFDNTTDTKSYFNLPLGARYIINVGDLIVGPQIMYHVQLGASDNLKAYNGGSKASYLDAGINARWKIFQGGVFYNAGGYVKYTGFRAGLAF